MVNFNNFSSRYNPSVHTGRENIRNRYVNNANNRRMEFLEQGYPPPTFSRMPPILDFGVRPIGGFNMGGFTQVNIQSGPSKAMMQGTVLGQCVGWGLNFYNQCKPQITNFFHKIFV